MLNNILAGEKRQVKKKDVWDLLTQVDLTSSYVLVLIKDAVDAEEETENLSISSFSPLCDMYVYLKDLKKLLNNLLDTKTTGEIIPVNPTNVIVGNAYFKKLNDLEYELKHIYYISFNVLNGN